VSAQPDPYESQIRRAQTDFDTPAGWVASAACHGRTALFYAEDPFSQRLAVMLCRRCPVRQECLAEVQALEQPGMRYGVRAGFTAAERKGWGR
jgi:hypothetical protein